MKMQRPDWVEAEDGILVDVYPDGGWRAVQAALLEAGHVERQKDAIHKRAHRLNVRSNSPLSRPRTGRWRNGVLNMSRPYEVPVHEYTEPDIAMRDWRCAEPGQPAWRVA